MTTVKGSTIVELPDKRFQFWIWERREISLNPEEPSLCTQFHGYLGKQAACDVSAQIES